MYHQFRRMLLISSLEGVDAAWQAYHPKRVISLLSEDEAMPSFEGLGPQAHLALYVEKESCARTISNAARERARRIISFVDEWDGAGDILIHCNRGVSRSTAAAFVVMCMREPQSHEVNLMKRLRGAAPHADPCPLLVTYADEILGRAGAMIDAVDDLGPPCAAAKSSITALPLAA